MPDFRADCGRCCGLCCVAPDQLAAQGFPVDKPANTPCLHIDDQHRCSIHATRRHHGYQPCQTFDCFGAGQWVTQRLFDGAAWTDSPETARQMFAAYRYWVPRFEAAALIEAALPYVTDESRRSLTATLAELIPADTGVAPGPDDAARLRREILTTIRAVLAARTNNV